MIQEAVDFKYLLLDNYKKLKIDESELVVILMIDHLLLQSNAFIDADLLSLKMTINVRKIDEILANLLQKGLISYVVKNKKTTTSLEPLRKKLYKEFQMSVMDDELVSQPNIEKKMSNIYSQFETLLNRTLSPVELSKIREWISFGYSDEKIIEALKEALSKNKKSLRSVDKILLTWQKRDDIENEGSSPINSDWDKNLEETIRIAKTSWIKDE